jgi:hypothetical protein
VTSTLQVSWVEPPQAVSASDSTTLSAKSRVAPGFAIVDRAHWRDLVNIRVDAASGACVDDAMVVEVLAERRARCSALAADLAHTARWPGEVDLIYRMPCPLRANGPAHLGFESVVHRRLREVGTNDGAEIKFLG